MTKLERACLDNGLTVAVIAKGTGHAKTDIREMMDGTKSLDFKITGFLVDNKINMHTITGRVKGRFT